MKRIFNRVALAVLSLFMAGCCSLDKEGVRQDRAFLEEVKKVLPIVDAAPISDAAKHSWHVLVEGEEFRIVEEEKAAK